MIRSHKLLAASMMLAFATTAQAANIVFDTDPFQGTTARTTAGRQVVGGAGVLREFDIANDQFQFRGVFGVDQISLVNGFDTDIPATGVNTVVIQNTGTPFLAGTAADLIAARIDEAGPGFFIYFNTNVGTARLVYSTDLSDNTADLAILGRLQFNGNPVGLDAFPSFTSANFAAVPEPSSVVLSSIGGLALACGSVLRRRRARS